MLSNNLQISINSYFSQPMNFFLKGDFKLNDNDPKPAPRNSNSREKSREKDKSRALVNAGKNIINEPIPDMLDNQLSKHILRQFAAEIPPPPSIKSEKKISSKDMNYMGLPPKQKSSLPSSENDLLTSMASRLKVVEMTNKNLREQLKEKTLNIEKLKSQNIFLKGFRQDSSKQYQKMKNLQQQNQELKKKVTDMEVYLQKYGLKWVGNKLEGKLQSDKMKQAIKKGNYQYRLPSQIDINTIRRRIEQLNGGLHSQGMGTQIYQQQGVHKFRKAEPLPVGFFGNGIAIKGYKFFTYKSKESLQILGDLVDGYFPYVLKAKYPNGVFLKVVDKLIQKYDQQTSGDNICTFESNQSKDFKPPSKQQFLSKLPKSIIKNGKVINIRGQIQKRMNGQCDNQIKQEQQDQENQFYQKNQGITVFKTDCHLKLDKKIVQQEEICTLKVRNQQGEVFILHLEKEKKMSDVYQWMKKVIKQNFKVMSNFPRRSYESSEETTLDDLGFFPNAMLHIQSNPQ